MYLEEYILPSWSKNVIYNKGKEKNTSHTSARLFIYTLLTSGKEEKMDTSCFLSQPSYSSSSFSALNRLTLQPFPYHNYLLTL
jgi:hypothetical protein